MAIWIAAGALGFLGLIVTFSGVGGMRKGRGASGGIGAIMGIVLMTAGGIVALAGLNLRTYERLTAEQIAARITFTAAGQDHYTVAMQTADDAGVLGPEETFELDGSQWLMGARIIKFPGWANVAGLDAVYRLEVVTSFTEGWIQQGSPRLLNEESAIGVDVWNLARKQGRVAQIDASYGNAAYGPMADGAVFEVSVTQSGLVSRAVSPQATTALGTWDGRSPPPQISEDLIVEN